MNKNQQLISYAALQSFVEGIIIIDEEQVVQLINPVACRLLSTSIESALGKHITTIAHMVKVMELINRKDIGRVTLLNESYENYIISPFDDNHTLDFRTAPVIDIDRNQRIATLIKIKKERRPSSDEILQSTIDEMHRPLEMIRDNSGNLCKNNVAHNKELLQILSDINTRATKILEVKQNVLQLYNREKELEKAQDRFMEWKYEGIGYLSFVRGVSNLLLNRNIGELNNEQTEWIEKIDESIKNAIEHWHIISEYFLVLSGMKVAELKKIDLHEVINAFLSHIEYTRKLPNPISVNLPDNLSHIKGDLSFLVRTINYLVYPYSTDYSSAKSFATIEATYEENSVKVHITTKTDRSDHISITPNDFFLMTRPFIAKKMIAQHGSEIQMIVSNQSIDFYFTLPIWNEIHAG